MHTRRRYTSKLFSCGAGAAPRRRALRFPAETVKIQVSAQSDEESEQSFEPVGLSWTGQQPGNEALLEMEEAQT
jgi:hypothetical protein